MTETAPDGLFLHASAVIVAGGALLFLGHSTSGKSTIARMLGRAFPAWADDSVFAARGADGQWRVVDGGFRFGRDDLTRWPEILRRRFENGGGGARLGGCLRIHKGEQVRLEPLAPAELARILMDAAMEIDLQRKFGRPKSGERPSSQMQETLLQMRRKWFRQVAEIARTCPGGNLWFSKETPADELGAFLRSWVEGFRKA